MRPAMLAVAQPSQAGENAPRVVKTRVLLSSAELGILLYEGVPGLANSQHVLHGTWLFAATSATTIARVCARRVDRPTTKCPRLPSV